MTSQIPAAIDKILLPLGTAVVIEAANQCMITRGVQKPRVTMVTNKMLDVFRDNDKTRREFLSMVGNSAVGG